MADKQQAIRQLVAIYRDLRDQKAEIDKQAKDAKAEIDVRLRLIEARLLKEFNASGAESIRTAAGTAFKTTKTSASVSDRDAFLRWVASSGAWEFITNHVSKEAVAAYKEEHADLPPGVNWREEITIAVRAA